MRGDGYRRGVVALILLLLLFSLYTQTRSLVIKQEPAVSALHLRFRQQNAELNQSCLLTFFRLRHNYDELVQGMSALRGIMSEMEILFRSPGLSGGEHEKLFAALQKAVDKKERLLEDYKSANALLKNSQRFLPVALDNFAREVSRNNPNNASLQQAFLFLMPTLLNNSRMSANAFRQEVLDEVERLKKMRPLLSTKERKLFDAVTTHVAIIGESVATTRRLLDALLDGATEEANKELYASHQALIKREYDRTHIFRLLLFGSALLLFGYLLYILFLLRRSVKSLNRQKFILDQHVLVTVADTDWKITYANDTLLQASGYQREEIIGMDQRQLYGGGDAERLFDEINDIVSHGLIWKGELPNRSRDGAIYWVSVSVIPAPDDKGRPHRYFTLRTDITDWKMAEEERARLFKAIEQAADSILISDRDGVIQYVNPALEAMTGYDRTEIIGRKPSLFKSEKQDQAFYHHLWGTILGGDVWSGRLVNRRKDGSLYEEAATITPVYGADGEINNFVAVKSDVTEREMLSKAQRFFSAMTSHELRTPLTKIELVRMLVNNQVESVGKCQESDQILSVLTDIYDDLARVVSSTSLLAELQISIKDRKKTPLNLRALLLSSVNIAKTRLEDQARKIEIDVDFGSLPVEWEILCDQSLFQRAVSEVLSNSVKFSPDGNRIKVLVESEPPWIHIVIRDDGVGMNDEELGMVVEPFFSSLDPNQHHTSQYQYLGGGSGLGLTIANLIMDAHGGRLKVASLGKERGTTVTLSFPAQEEEQISESAS